MADFCVVIFCSAITWRLFESFWDIHSTYVSNSSVQFTLDYFVPNLIFIREFSFSVTNFLTFENSVSFSTFRNTHC